jgi:NAD(P)-dependent dehydrogenase (short-subunit alcohol dehydrogenase family)
MTQDFNSQKIALITGANKGLGFETARQLGKKGVTVLLGSRDQNRGDRAAESLRPELGRVESIPLDVTDPRTIQQAAERIEAQFGRLDILINNAGIIVRRGSVSEPEIGDLRQTLETNLFGAFAMTKAFLALLRKSREGRIVNVSSTLGSIQIQGDPAWRDQLPATAAYTISKTALNAMTVLLANELRDSGIKVNAVCPGYAATDLNQFQGTKTPQEAVKVIVRYALLAHDGPTGGFFNEEAPLPW